MSPTGELWHDGRNLLVGPTHLSFKNKAVLVTGTHGAGLGHYAAVKYAALRANPVTLSIPTHKKDRQVRFGIPAHPFVFFFFFQPIVTHNASVSNYGGGFLLFFSLYDE